jgi:hypothetical protein
MVEVFFDAAARRAGRELPYHRGTVTTNADDQRKSEGPCIVNDSVAFSLRRWRATLWLLVLIGCIGCTKKEEPARPGADIMRDKLALPALFLTENTHEEVIAPIGSQPVHNGQTCWHAQICTHPDCPGQGKNGRPYLFINSKPGSDSYCPACLGSQDPSSLSAEQGREYRWAVKPYVIQESAERLQKLDQEHQRRIDELEERRNR